VKTTPHDRLPLLDIARGVAILAILFMNISDMGGSFYGFVGGDPRRFGWTGSDRAVWWTREVLVSGTARCMLELLFGAGLAVLLDRAGASVRAYAWRMAVLFGLGVAHALLLLWPGDILHTYALAALVATLFHTLSPRLLVTLGLAMAVLQLVGAGGGAIAANQARAEVQVIEARLAEGGAVTAAERRSLAEQRKRGAAAQRARAELEARIAAEDRARSGPRNWQGAASWVGALWGVSAWLVRSGWELLFIWEAASTMLIGVALYRWGVLGGARSRPFYLRLMLAGYAVGLPLRIWAAADRVDPAGALSVAAGFGEFARLATTLGHLGLFALLAARPAMRPFAAAGRVALSLYILQTIVCLWVLYPPWGLTLYNRQSWTALMATAFAVNAGLLLLAVWWTRRFAIGPVEWAWRSIVAGRALPFRA
jgi:uncharacterized protein